jgi:uncharacterized Zn-finger protein
VILISIPHTFLQVHASPDLPQKICLECQDIIRKAHSFKLKVHNSTSVLTQQEKQDYSSLVEDKDTQTDSPSSQSSRRNRTQDVIEFDENFDSINLQSEDSIFEIQTNPLLDVHSQQSNTRSLNVKKEELGLSEDDYDENRNEDDETDVTALVIIKSEPELICDYNEDGDDDEDQNEAKYKIHKCETCNKSFSRATHLKRHRLTHEEGKLQCTICEKRFTRVDHLNLHIASNHSDTKPFQCEIPDCKKGFVRQEHLKKHIEAKHSDGTKDKEICEICQKSFTTKKNLRTHLKSHSSGDGKGGLACKYCSLEFTDKTELNDHLTREHQNEKPYLCSECGLRFVRNDYLVIHMRRHMGVKPYKCRFCEKGFPRATDLTVHERYHTNEKTHLCNLCGKGEKSILKFFLYK